MGTSVMKVWVVFLFSAILAMAQAEVEDDFDDEDIVVEDEEDAATDDVQIEKVKIDISYLSPDDNVDFYFMDHFDDASTLGSKWTKSQAKKEGTDDTIAKYDGVWEVEALAKDALPGDTGLVLKSKPSTLLSLPSSKSLSSLMSVLW